MSIISVTISSAITFSVLLRIIFSFKNKILIPWLLWRLVKNIELEEVTKILRH